jgi:LysM repeat protein
MLSAPTSLRAKKLGYPMLADLQMLGLEYQHTSIATTRSLIKSKPDLVRNFMRAYVEGVHYAKTHRRETMEIITKYLRTDDKDVLDDTYESIVANLVPEKPYPTLKGIQIILRELGIKDPNARSAVPEQFVDLTFIKELDSSGFVDRLYKSTAVATAAPRSEPAPAPVVAKERPVPLEVKAKTATAEEKTKPIAKQPTPSAEKTTASIATARTTKSAAEEYTVKAGDTLSKLAQRYYNSMSKWERIYEANREILKNPNYIYIGQKLMIPIDDQAS